MKVSQFCAGWVGLSVSLLFSATTCAQGQMKVSTSSPGGKEGSVAACLARITAGYAGPVARGVWQVVASGTINYCVHAGVDGDFWSSTNASPTIALRTDSTPLSFTISLHDWRGGPDEIWIASVEGKTLPHAEFTSTMHATHASRSAPLTESTPAGSLNMLANAWCASNQNWGSRPKLVVKLTGPALRGRDASDNSANVCEVSFGPPESSRAVLQTVLGVPAYPARRLAAASPVKPSLKVPKSTP